MKKVAIFLVLFLAVSPILGSMGCAEEKEAREVAAQFVGVPATGTVPLEVSFADQSTGDVTSWEWDFDNNGTVDSTSRNPTHTYSVAGTYSVSLTVTGPDDSDTETKTNYIRVAEIGEIIADFVGSPTSGTALLEVQFTDQSAGEITDWVWDFGDGEASAEQNPSHTYSAVGTYTVSLKAIGPDGSDTETKANYIEAKMGDAEFSASPTSGDPPLTVQFTDQSTGTIAAWAWDFGDGETSTEQSPSHTYNAVGEHTVSLTITGPAGSDTETKVDYIAVGVPELEPTTWKLSHGFPETGIRGKSAQYFKELVEEYTDGKITVDIYPNNTLFDPFTAMSAVRAGTVDVTFDPPYYWGWAGVPWVGFLYTWGLIPTWEHAWGVFSNPEWYAEMSKVWEPLGVKYLGMTAETLYMCYPNNKQPVDDFKDMEGWRDAIPTGSEPTAGVVWIGFEIVYLPYEEHASAFQTGLVDTYSASISTFVGMEIWDYAKYLIAGANATGSLVVMNEDTWDELPAYWQDVMTNEVMPQVIEYAYTEGEALEAGEIALLEANLDDFYIATPEQMVTMLEGELELENVKAMMWDAGEAIMDLLLEWQP